MSIPFSALSLTALPICVLLGACGGGSDGDDGPAAPTDTDEGLTVQNPAVPSPLTAGARAAAVASLESLDAVMYLSGSVRDYLGAVPDGDSACAGGGTRSRAASGALSFTECVLAAEMPVSWSGELRVTDAADIDSTVSASNLVVTNGGYQMTVVSGTLAIGIDGASRSLSSERLMLTLGNQAVTLSSIALTVNAADNAAKAISFSSVAELPDIGNAVNISSDGLVAGDVVSCPDAGTLLLTESDASITINGAGGENLSFTTDGFTDTLSCGEVRSIMGGMPTPTVFLPPPPPSSAPR